MFLPGRVLGAGERTALAASPADHLFRDVGEVIQKQDPILGDGKDKHLAKGSQEVEADKDFNVDRPIRVLHFRSCVGGEAQRFRLVRRHTHEAIEPGVDDGRELRWFAPLALI